MINQISLQGFPPNKTLPPPWKTFVRGNGALETAGETLRLIASNCTAGQYTDAQIDDYQGLSRREFLWRPPLQMTVRARFSHPSGQLKGTAGFGFWNDPFMMTGKRRPALPRAIWFFYSSPPSRMKLDINTPGPGWKVGMIDTIRRPFFALLPVAPLAVPLMNIGPLYRTFWPIGQRAIGVKEAMLPVEMTEWHTYVMAWKKRSVCFMVDGKEILNSNLSPRGPLGFVLWLDNQYMIVTPWGKFGHGLLDASGEQWMEVSRVEISGG